MTQQPTNEARFLEFTDYLVEEAAVTKNEQAYVQGLQAVLSAAGAFHETISGFEDLARGLGINYVGDEHAQEIVETQISQIKNRNIRRENAHQQVLVTLGGISFDDGLVSYQSTYPESGPLDDRTYTDYVVVLSRVDSLFFLEHLTIGTNSPFTTVIHPRAKAPLLFFNKSAEEVGRDIARPTVYWRAKLASWQDILPKLQMLHECQTAEEIQPYLL